MDGSGDGKSAADRVARNQALFRSVNEQIESTNEKFGVALERANFVCECADEHCMEQIAVPLRRYEAIRAASTHFLVKPEHVYPDFERVVEERATYVVVEKFGEAGKQAVRLDQRRRLRSV